MTSSRPSLSPKHRLTDARTYTHTAHSTYSMELDAAASLDINIPLLNFHKDWNWAKAIGSWAGKPLPPKCVGL